MVLAIAGISGYLAFINKTEIIPPENKPAVPVTNTDQNTNKVAYSGTWKQAQFPTNDYRHSINIELPSAWQFNCCGDTTGFSAHTIYPTSSESQVASSPRITVYDFVLSGCPDGEYASCSIDQLQEMTANQYMTSVTKHLDRHGEIAGLESLKKTGTIKLNNFTANVDVYSGTSRANQSVDLYLIQSAKGVVGVAFQQPQSFDLDLRMEFLNKITSN